MRARIRWLVAGLMMLAAATTGAEEGATNAPAADAPVPAEKPAAEVAPALAVPPAAAVLDVPAAPAASRTNAWLRWLHDHVELELRLSCFGLTENTRREYDAAGTFKGGFLGSIDRLVEEQSYVPLPVLRVYPVRWLGLEAGLEQLQVETRTFYDDHTDGTFRLLGPSVLLVGRWPNASRFTPFAAGGVVIYWAEFEMEGAWHHGFNSYAAYDEWRADGAPPYPNAGYERNIVADDLAVAYLVQAGVQVRLTRHWWLEGGARYVWLDLDAHYWLSFYGVPFEDHGTYNFPLDYLAGYAGLVCAF